MLVAGVLLCSLVLLRAPEMWGAEVPRIVVGLTLLPFAAAIGSLLLWKARWRAAPLVLVTILFVLLTIVAAVRASYFGTITSNYAFREIVQITLVAMLACLAFLREPRAAYRQRYGVALCWSPVVFVAVNVALLLVGYVPSGQDPSTGLEATTLGLLGVSAERVLFAAGGGINGLGPTAAAAFAVCATFAALGERRKLALLGAGICMYAILATDSRAALVFSLAAAALVILTPRRHRRFGWVALALPVAPAVLAVALGGLEDTSVAASFSRTGGAQSISQGTGRTVVWDATWRELKQPKVEHIFGFGQNGQVVSGVSVEYLSVFRDENDSDRLSHTTHNIALQTALDLGWVGLACLIVLTAQVLARLAWWARQEPVYAALLAGALAVLFDGIVEASPTLAHLDSFAWWVMVVFAASRAHEAPIPPPPGRGE